MPKPAKSIEEIFPLIDFCKLGKLAEVSQWIDDGMPLDPPPAKRRSPRRMPLQIAIEKNFYSLAELLLEGGADPFANGNALDYCVTKGRPEIAGLLLKHDVPADSVDFVYVCEMGNPDMIRLLLDHGADPTTDFAFYHAIVGTTKPALGIFKKWKEKFPALQEQLNAALLHFVVEGRAQGVALCLWAGADPEKPAIDVSSSGKEEWREEPLVAAAWKGKLAILKTLHPEKYPDYLAELMRSSSGGKGMVDYLLELGAPLNDKVNGGSALLDRRIGHLGWEIGWSLRKDVTETLDMIRYLVGKGAMWIPDDKSDYRGIRGNFKNLGAAQIVDSVRILRDGEAATVEVIEELLRTPKMREVLGRHRSEVDKILHPPPPVPPPTPEKSCSDADSDAQTPVPKVKKTPIAEVRKRTESFLLDFLCQTPAIPFWDRCLAECLPNARTRKIMGLVDGDGRAPVNILNDVAERLDQRIEGASLSIGERSYSGLASVIFCLEEGCDWERVIKQAWSLSGREPNAYLLTDVGAKTLKWLQSPDRVDEFVKEVTLSHRMGMKGRVTGIEDHLNEIGLKTPQIVKWEERGDRRRDPPRCYKLWLEDQMLPWKTSDAWNPVLDVDLCDYQRDELESCRDRIIDYLLEVRPEGDAPVILVSLNSYSALRTCFPKWCCDRSYPRPNLPGFFSRLKMPPEVRLAYDFRDEAPAWFVAVQPTDGWKEALEALVERKNRPSLQEKYQLSDDAAKLLSWIEELSDKEIELGLSPEVENALQEDVGITAPWDDDNLGAYLQILIDEINGKTPWDLRLQPWKHYNSWRSRIGIRKSDESESSVIRQIQLYALEHGKAVQAEEVRAKLVELLDEDL